MTKAESILRNTAYKAVNAALKDGTLVRQPCAKCGKSKTDAHHRNYNKPLEVMWLCRRCHLIEHRNFKSKKKECRFCKELFIPLKINQKYCDKICRETYWQDFYSEARKLMRQDK